MNQLGAPIGEDDLQAFIDDRLDDTRRLAVTSYLDDHAEIASRLMAESAQREALRSQLTAKALEPIPTRLRIANIRAARQSRKTGWLRNAAAAAALMALGAGSGWWAHGSMQFTLSAEKIVAKDAFAAYRTYIVEVNHPVEVRASDEAHLIQWLSKRLGRPIQVPDLASFGFKLIGGRVLPAENDIAAMLMYDDENGSRLTVYIRGGSSGETAFRFMKDGDVATFAWLDRGYGFAVTARSERARLLPIAEAVYKTLEAGGA